MRRVIVKEWMTLDGVVQAPGAEDEDPSGGFEHGGWHLRYFDDASDEAWVLENVDGGGRLPARPPHVRGVRLPLAERVRGGAGHRRAAEHETEVRGDDGR